MRGTATPWGLALDIDLDALERFERPLTAVVISGDGLEVKPLAPPAEVVDLARRTHARWGDRCTFHLFAPGFEVRWDRGVGTRLTLGEQGPFETREVTGLLMDSRRAPGVTRLAQAAPTGRIRLREFLSKGRVVELLLEELV